MSDLTHQKVKSYALTGHQMWQRGDYPHGPQHDCIRCADVRAYLGITPLRGLPVPMLRQREERAS